MAQLKALNSSLTLHFLICCKESLSKFFQLYCQNIHIIGWLLAVSTAMTLVQATPVSHRFLQQPPTDLIAPSFLSFASIRRLPSLQWLLTPLMIKANTLCDQAPLTASAAPLPLHLCLITLAVQTAGAPFPQDFCTCSSCLEFSYPRIRRAYSTSTPHRQHPFLSCSNSNVAFSVRPCLVTFFRISIPYHPSLPKGHTHTTHTHTHTHTSIPLPWFHFFFLRFITI